MLDRAVALGFDAVVTGHYAQLRTDPDGLIEMHRAEDMGKDQSYVLGVLTQEQLAHSMFPLGDTPKPEIRLEAERRGLAVAAKPDSHDICFISDGDTGGWLSEKLLRASTAAGPSSPTTARCSATHEGSWRYTIGQRRGLRIGTPAPDGQPRYVLDIEPASGTVTVGSARGPRRRRAHGDQAALVRRGPRRRRWSAPCSCARTATSTGRW